MTNILFICALAEEKNALTDLLDNCINNLCISSQLNIQLEQYRQGELDIFVCESGMGNVNAGVSLALILNQIKISQVVLIGVGGALHCQLNIGDMIISQQVIQHDYFSSLDSGNYLMRPGDLILSEQQSLNYDPILRSTSSVLNTKKYLHPDIRITHALIASGNEFVGTAQRKDAIFNNCDQALLVDMEASAIANVANQFSTPFLIAKTISDKLHSNGSISQDFSEFLNIASKNAAIIAQLIIDDFKDQSN